MKSDETAAVGTRQNWPEIDESTSVGPLRPVVATLAFGDAGSEDPAYIRRNWRKLARPPRLERGTPGLEGRCSIRLSYGRS